MARTKECRECCEPINRKARRCPHCRAKQGANMGSVTKLVLTLFGLGMLSAALAPNTVTPARSTITKPKPPASKPPSQQSKQSKRSSQGYLLPIPLEPNVRFYVLEKGGTAARPTMVTKRVGSSGTSYSQKEFDCAAGTWRYLGDGDTLAQMRKSAPAPTMGPVQQGSTAWHQWQHACGRGA